MGKQWKQCQTLVLGDLTFSATGQGIDLNYCDAEWYALETNSDLSVILIAAKYCISDSSVDYYGYSISSNGFLSTLIDNGGHLN